MEAARPDPRADRAAAGRRAARATRTSSSWSERVAEEIEAAIAFAEAGTFEPVEDLERFVYWEGAAA